jgi:hypothetical protein
MRVSVLFTLEKLSGDFARQKKLPAGAQKFAFEVKGTVPQLAQHGAHAHFSVGIFLAAMCAEFGFIGQRVEAISTVTFHREVFTGNYSPEK